MSDGARVEADLSIYALPKVDSHCHVLDPAGFPYPDNVPYRPSGQETGSADYFTQVLQAYGVRHALLVGPNSGYGTDNRCLLDAIARGAGRFKGIAVVPNQASRDELQALKAQGVIGIAFNYALHGFAYYADTSPLMQRLADLGMFVQVQTERDQLVELGPRLLDSGAPLMVDHCGRPAVSEGVHGRGFDALLKLSGHGRATVKISGFSKFSQQDLPFDDVQPFTDALLQAFGPDHCVWASDWPFLRAPRRLDYGPLLQLAGRTLATPALRQAVLWDTPRRLFGFV